MLFRVPNYWYVDRFEMFNKLGNSVMGMSCPSLSLNVRVSKCKHFVSFIKQKVVSWILSVPLWHIWVTVSVPISIYPCPRNENIRNFDPCRCLKYNHYQIIAKSCGITLGTQFSFNLAWKVVSLVKCSMHYQHGSTMTHIHKCIGLMFKQMFSISCMCWQIIYSDFTFLKAIGHLNAEE